MTDEVKRIVTALKCCPNSHFKCEQCPVYNPGTSCQNELNAAYLIESLSTELEQVKRERDAAIKDIERACITCKYFKSDWEWRESK